MAEKSVGSWQHSLPGQARWRDPAKLRIPGAQPALQQFLDEHGARDSYADLGRLLSETEVNELPSGLTEEKALIADTFKRFADEVVAPLAGGFIGKTVTFPMR